MFVLIGKADCKWCVRAKELLEREEEPYECFSYSHDPVLKDFLIANELTTVPQIWYNGRYIGGCNELEDYLKENTNG